MLLAGRLKNDSLTAKYLFPSGRLHAAPADGVLLLHPPPPPGLARLPEQPDSCLHVPQLVPQHLGGRRNPLGPIALQHSLVVITIRHGVWMDSMPFHLKKYFDCDDRLVVEPTQLHEDAIADLVDRVKT